jgi:acetyltransferase-like isoleucine patch superfamily enzyme
VGENVQIGPDVRIECQRLRLGDGVRIGCQADADFRAVAGVRIQVRELELGDEAKLGRSVSIRGGHIHLGHRVHIKDWNDIHVKGRLHIDADGTVNEHCEISGVDIQIGRELWMLPYAKIGGGSAFEVQSSLKAGHFVHIGMHCFINTARAVTLGDEVGLGTHTALYTHGAYASELRGAPVAFGEIHIGDRTWIPGAIVNPGVSIGHDCVIGVGSVVTRGVPDGALAAGAPCKVIRENAYPRELSPEERLEKMTGFLRDFATICTDRHRVDLDETALEITLDDDTLIVYRETVDSTTLASLRGRGAARLITLAYSEYTGPAIGQETFIDLKHRHIDGVACAVSERLLNQLRRYGTRFYYESASGHYQKWD